MGHLVLVSFSFPVEEFYRPSLYSDHPTNRYDRFRIAGMGYGVFLIV